MGRRNVEESKTYTRSSSEPITTPGADGDRVDVQPESGHEEPDAESYLQRKPIPLELSCAGRLVDDR